MALKKIIYNLRRHPGESRDPAGLRITGIPAFAGMTAFLFIGVLFFTLTQILPVHATDAPKESAYARVMRTKTLKCGVMLWPPYFDADPNTGKIKGMIADIDNELAKMLDLKIDFVEITLGQQVEELNNGRVDAICNDGAYVFSAIKFVDYSKPLFLTPASLYVRADDNRFKTPADLDDAKYSIAGIDGDGTLLLAERSIPKTRRISLPGSTDLASLFLNVTGGKADATIGDPLAVMNFNTNNKKGLKLLSKDAVAVYPTGFSVKKGEQELLNMLNAGVDALWNANVVQPILKKYDPAGKAFYFAAKTYEVPR